MVPSGRRSQVAVAPGLLGRRRLGRAATEQEFGGERWTWYDVSKFGDADPIDVLIVDGPPGTNQPLARYPALPALRSRLAPGALVLLDDGIRDDEKAIVER